MKFRLALLGLLCAASAAHAQTQLPIGSTDTARVGQATIIVRHDTGVPMDANGSIPIAQSAVTLTDRSGTIATGGTSQALFAANSARRFGRFVNPITATESCWINDKGAAASASNGSSFEVTPGASVIWANPAPGNAINVVCATSTHAFEAAEG